MYVIYMQNSNLSHRLKLPYIHKQSEGDTNYEGTLNDWRYLYYEWY